jgi:oxygen-dependent protoporphyrinogen oxidase
MSATDRRVMVIGGGITGLTVAAGLIANGFTQVIVREADEQLGGKIRTSPFNGLAAVDEGPDAFLTRVPDAVGLARRLGLGDQLTSPTSASAAVWYPSRHGGRLHPLPAGLVLGVPASVSSLARTGLLSWRGKLRAGLEPLLPRTSTTDDSLGAYMRSRVGNEAHERLVDALVGSIYAADTDRASLRAVPQLSALAEGHRSLLLGARRARSSAPAAAGPIFATPTTGMSTMIDALAQVVTAGGGTILTGSPVSSVEPCPSGTEGRFQVDGQSVDDVVMTTPGRLTSEVIQPVAPEAATLLAQMDHAGVIMVTLAVAPQDWPQRLVGRSGYLVPKRVQQLVTAASFGTQKWAHWNPPDGGQVLRVSLGRDGLEVDDLSDTESVDAVIREMSRHLEVDLAPTATRVTRWPAAFPQYRPLHHRWVESVERALPKGLYVAGASYRGIGLPACIRDGNRVVEQLIADLHVP